MCYLALAPSTHGREPCSTSRAVLRRYHTLAFPTDIRPNSMHFSCVHARFDCHFEGHEVGSRDVLLAPIVPCPVGAFDFSRSSGQLLLERDQTESQINEETLSVLICALPQEPPYSESALRCL